MNGQVKRILVTGVSGMLGRGVAQRLAEAGHSVVGVDVVPCALDNANFSFASADVRDLQGLSRILQSAPAIDVIVHGGGVSGSMVMRDEPAQVIDINVGGTTNLLEAARFHGIPRFVQCSSIMVYGPVSIAPVSEDRALSPVNVYGATKVACEALVRSYSSEFSLSAALLRIAHVYGPGRKTYCPVRAMITGALLRQPVTIETSPDSRRQLIHSDDVVRAIELAALDERPECIIANIGPGVDWSLVEIADAVREQIGPVAVSFESSRPNADYLTPPLSQARAGKVWGWAPQISLAAGIVSFAAELKAEGLR